MVVNTESVRLSELSIVYKKNTLYLNSDGFLHMFRYKGRNIEVEKYRKYEIGFIWDNPELV